MMRNHTLLSLAVFVSSLYTAPLHAQHISTFAGTGTAGYSGNGGGAGAAQLSSPSGVATFGYYNVFIADQGNHAVRKVYAGLIGAFAGNDTAGNTGDGHPATAARLNAPHAIAADASGNIYIADYAANVVRKVNTLGIITTIAGTGTAGYTGDGGPATAARLNNPYGIAVDGFGNIYIADATNNVVRKLDASGLISTIAGDGTGAGMGMGNGGYSGDGGAATGAKMDFPAGVATDVAGNVYIADAFNNVVRKVDVTTGIITTVAGNGMPGYYGDGGAATNAKLKFPSGVAADGFGNLYIADENNNVVREVSATGTITTIAGTGAVGYQGDGGAATAAQLNGPNGVAVDGNGLIYIADHGNNVVRLVGATAGVNSVQSSETVDIRPNPSGGYFTVALPQSANTITVTVTDISGRTVDAKTVSGKAKEITFGKLNPGVYLVKLEGSGNVSAAKVTVW